jgi:type II secretory pathway pseudopilin PulG
MLIWKSHVRSSPKLPRPITRYGMIDMRHLTNFKRRLTGEAGFVLPTAIIVLLIVTVLTGAAIAVATQTSTSTTRDGNTKAALEAAEAGLQVASYRLTKLAPAPTQCITAKALTTPIVGTSYCEEESAESLGNGAKFRYWTTPELTSAQACTGVWVTPPSPKDTSAQRCVTAVGTVNGVPRRLQERVFSLISAPLFEVEGILGYTSVSIKQNGIVNGEIGSNGLVLLENGVKGVTKTVLGPNGKEEGGGAAGEIVKSPSAFTRPTVPIGASATSATTVGECVTPTLEEVAAAKNCDVLITNGINKINKLTEEDPVNGSVSFNSSTRSLSMGASSVLELKGGIYNFCDFQVPGHGAALKIALGATVKLFIDSAARTGSGCASDLNSKGELQAGKLEFKNGLSIENANTNATSLQIYVYDGSGGTIVFGNNSSSAFYGTIVAPYSKVEVKSNGSFIGGIEANEVALINNFTFNWAPEVGEEKQEKKSPYERKSWEECPPTYAGANPQTGC